MGWERWFCWTNLFILGLEITTGQCYCLLPSSKAIYFCQLKATFNIYSIIPNSLAFISYLLGGFWNSFLTFALNLTLIYSLWFAAEGGSSCSPVFPRKQKGDYIWNQSLIFPILFLVEHFCWFPLSYLDWLFNYTAILKRILNVLFSCLFTLGDYKINFSFPQLFSISCLVAILFNIF